MPVSSCLIELALYNTDASLREVGLNLAVAIMRKGECCHLQVQPQYGYGEKGTHSFICWLLERAWLWGHHHSNTILCMLPAGTICYSKEFLSEKCWGN